MGYKCICLLPKKTYNSSSKSSFRDPFQSPLSEDFHLEKFGMNKKFPKCFEGNARGVQPTDQREGTSLCARDERSGI
jgi:hypothetical protein